MCQETELISALLMHFHFKLLGVEGFLNINHPLTE